MDYIQQHPRAGLIATIPADPPMVPLPRPDEWLDPKSAAEDSKGPLSGRTMRRAVKRFRRRALADALGRRAGRMMARGY